MLGVACGSATRPTAYPIHLHYPFFPGNMRIATVLLPTALALAREGTRHVIDEPSYTRNGLTWTDGVLRMNEIQVVGTHNSYHVEADPKEQSSMAKATSDDTINNIRYTHPALDVQLEDSRVRSIE
jgi:hypothetical protein